MAYHIFAKKLTICQLLELSRPVSVDSEVVQAPYSYTKDIFMKLIPILTALSAVLAISALSTSSVEARNNFSANEQMILNNFGMQEQKLSDSINAYVSSGQLSPQQGASFQNQLSQLSDDAMYAAADPGQTTMMINRFSSFANQITGSLQNPGAYTYVPTNPVYSLRPRNHYTNWQSRWQTSPRYNAWLNQNNANVARTNAQVRYNQAVADKQLLADKVQRDARNANYARAQAVEANQRRLAESRYRSTHGNYQNNQNNHNDHDNDHNDDHHHGHGFGH